MDDATRVKYARPASVLGPSGRLSGKVCLVTGGGSGIGKAAALRMAREGAAAVVIGGRRRAMGDAVAEEVRALGSESLFVASDVSREAEAERLVATAVQRFGRLDAVFNNAGTQENRAALTEQTAEAYAQVFDTNVGALFHGMRHQIPALIAAGGGAIVNNTSISGIRNAYPGLALYSASKAAANSLTRSAAMEYAAQGVRINAVAPGRVVTDMVLATGIDLQQIAATLPLRRMGCPDEVATAVTWLLSDEASYVVGHILCADGGFLAA
jgi:NAD(P)-dependent dehydrogenase (short-subunit alcohol dehydrogenase family)